VVDGKITSTAALVPSHDRPSTIFTSISWHDCDFTHKNNINIHLVNSGHTLSVW